MAQEKRDFNILFRRPKYPLIVISANNLLLAALNIKELAVCCLSATPVKEGGVVKAIDSTGEEFWYSPENCAISPGFAFKIWTKKQIIELYNNCDLVMDDTKYSEKSLSGKRLSHIIADICNLLRS